MAPHHSPPTPTSRRSSQIPATTSTTRKVRRVQEPGWFSCDDRPLRYSPYQPGRSAAAALLRRTLPSDDQGSVMQGVPYSSAVQQHCLTRSHPTEPHLPPDQVMSSPTWGLPLTRNEGVWGSNPQGGSTFQRPSQKLREGLFRICSATGTFAPGEGSPSRARASPGRLHPRSSRR